MATQFLMWRFNLLLFFALTAGVTGCIHDDPPVTYPTVVKMDESTLVLGHGDKLSLTVYYGAKSFTAPYTLDSSGLMEVQYIGSVVAVGKTLSTLRDEIKSRLADGYINEPIVALTIIELNSLTVSVSGMVARTGALKFTPGMSIVDVVALSGGFTPMARKNMVKVVRIAGNEHVTYKLPVEKMSAGERPIFPMLPGDEVFVPERSLVAQASTRIVRGRDRLCVVFGGTALLVSTLVIGGVFRWTQAAVAALVAFALLTQISSRRKLDRVSPIVLLLIIAIAMTALQLLPLPASVVELLDPTNAALRNDGAAIAHAAPWSCLSMDFAGTLRGLTYLITLLGVALVSLRLGASDRGRLLLVGGVAIACGLVAAVTALHSIVNAQLIYGVYAIPVAEPVLGPFVNPNHLGCLMAFGATISIGLAFYEKQAAAWRAVWVVTAVGCASMALLSESRGATVSLALGVIVTCALLVSRRLGEVASGPGRRNFSTGRLPIVVVLTLGFGLAVYSSAGGVAEQLGRTSLVELGHPASKFAAWKASAQLMRESPWVGVGRGAVEPVFTHAFPSSAQVTFGHLENEYIEAVVEWGIPVALALALVLGWCIVTGLRKWRDGPLAAAAIGGMAGVMFQSSVDFGVELLGVAVPVTIVASTLQLVRLREVSRLGPLRVVRAVIILALATSALALVSDRTSTLEEDHRALMAGNYKTLDQLATVIDRHPPRLLRVRDSRPDADRGTR